MTLVGTVALLLTVNWPSPGIAYAAAVFSLILGLLLLVGRPRFLATSPFLLVVLDFLWISVLVSSTGGGDSPFYPLYLLAAFGIAWLPTGPKAVAATAAGVAGYLAAVVAAGGAFFSAETGVEAGFVALFCGVAWTVGSALRRLGGRVSEASSTGAAERRRSELAEDLAARFGPTLGLSDLDGILRWTLEAARGVAGGSYAHVAELNGTRHRTVSEADSEVCPSWWHPTMQRLVLWSCREDRVLHEGETVHGIEGFVAVPVGPKGGEKWGAIILGGKRFDAAEVRALELLAGVAAPALRRTDDAPAGRDPVTGLPNRTSLHRVLDRQLSRGRALTVLMVGLNGLRDYERIHGLDAGDLLLRRVGRRMEEVHRRVYRSGDAGFVVVHVGASRAREVAGALRRLVLEVASGPGGVPGVSVGFVSVEAGEGDAYSVVDAAARALADAGARPEGIVGSADASPTAAPGTARRGAEVAEVVLALAETSELRGPYIGEHSKAVAGLSRRVGERLSLSEGQQRALELGALLHDLGKIGVPDYVLSKSGRLTEEEHEVMRRHPVLGARILSPVAELAPALPAVRHHHERFDGAGYPDGLAGEGIPLVARIVSVADAFDSLVRDRLHARGVSEEEALEEIENNSGSQFDPRVVRAFLDVMQEPGGRRTSSAG